MDSYLLSLLLKIDAAEKRGHQYFYRREESEDPHKEVAGLKELQRQSYITCGRFHVDNDGSGGYYSIGGPCRLEYRGREEIAHVNSRDHVERIRDTAASLASHDSVALDHLLQASRQLMSLDDARARKDAVRDCLSALEAFVKRASGTQDIRAATRELRSLGIGPDAIVKDGLSIWDRVHELYPDVRHGEPAGSDMSKAEALYWVERITAYVRFLSADERLQG